MAGQTQTQTIQRHAFVNPNRRHDYLYDPVHFLSSERDHARSTFQAHTSTDRVRRVPVYPTMFSELRHHPRFNVRLDVNDPVPKFVPRQWRGYADQAREALVRYTTFNYDPSVQVPPRHYPHVDVTGQERSKYFRRPIIPFMQQIAPDVVLAAARQDTLLAAGGGNRPDTPLVRNIGTQTDYRDSEAQTDPYTPEYVVRPGSQPELLTLATLSYGRGLPAGLAEVEMIERARVKRAWEATLPPLSDVSQLDKRRRMMDEMERKEWALREQEIEKLQEARLQVLLQLLKQREENQQELNTRRLDRLWSRKQKERRELSLKIRYEHIKSIRKLTRKRKNVEGKLERRDIIGEYANPGSQTFAPITRIGVFPDRGSEQYVVRSHFLQNYEGILQLESSLPRYVQQPKVKAPKQQTQTKEGFVKRQHRRMMQLVELHEENKQAKLYIKEMKNRGPEEKRPLRFLQKIEKPIPRPTTPQVEEPADEEEDRELAVIFLQQLIRGRAVQAMMYEGKEKRRELIKELRSTHALQEAEQKLKNQERLGVVALQRQRGLHMLKEAHVDEALGELEGESLGDMYDFLSKELIRLQEERRIHAFAMLAERQRRIREAEESGRRQLEERRRREEDEIFKQTVKVHQNSVNTYLEDIILGSMDRAADQVARTEIRDLANRVNDVAYEMEGRRSQLESEEIVAEMVHQFLIPEVQKETIREKIKVSQRRYLLAAHREIIKESDDIIYEGTMATTRSEAQDDAATSTDEQGEERIPTDEKSLSLYKQMAEQIVDNVISSAITEITDHPSDPVSSSDNNEDATLPVDNNIEEAATSQDKIEESAPPEEKVEESTPPQDEGKGVTPVQDDAEDSTPAVEDVPVSQENVEDAPKDKVEDAAPPQNDVEPAADDSAQTAETADDAGLATEESKVDENTEQ